MSDRMTADQIQQIRELRMRVQPTDVEAIRKRLDRPSETPAAQTILDAYDLLIEVNRLTADLAHQRAQIATYQALAAKTADLLEEEAARLIPLERAEAELAAVRSALEQIEARWRERIAEIFREAVPGSDWETEYHAILNCADELIHVLRHQEP